MLILSVHPILLTCRVFEIGIDRVGDQKGAFTRVRWTWQAGEVGKRRGQRQYGKRMLQARCGIGRADERYLVFASTLGRFPAGIHPFGALKGALRLAVIDNSRFGLVVRTPVVFRGVISESLRRRGYHVHGVDTLRLDIGDRFILDGEGFPAGRYQISLGPKLRFVVP